MNQSEAAEIRNLLTEAFIARPNDLAKSFGQTEDLEYYNFTGSEPQAVVNGVSLGIRAGNEYFVKIFTDGPPNVDKKALKARFNIHSNDVQVVSIGKITARNSPIRHRVRPAPPGVSIGHYQVNAGTLGCLVRDQRGGLYILSNNHVLANMNNGQLGDPILQPGSSDGGVQPDDVIATLYSYIPIQFSGFNDVDAALAAPVSPGSVLLNIPGIGRIKGIAAPKIGMEVVKYGRTTGLTHGKIVSRSGNVRIDFKGRLINFKNQFEVRGTGKVVFSQFGDSGSVIIESKTKRAVGLLFAGTDQGVTFANPIANVLRAFDVDIA